MNLQPHLCLTEPSASLRSACFSMLSMDILLARLAFLQAVWLLQNTQRQVQKGLNYKVVLEFYQAWSHIKIKQKNVYVI